MEYGYFEETGSVGLDRIVRICNKEKYEIVSMSSCPDSHGRPIYGVIYRKQTTKKDTTV